MFKYRVLFIQFITFLMENGKSEEVKPKYKTISKQTLNLKKHRLRQGTLSQLSHDK